MNWDDLRVARAVFDSGSYASAAARLRINETTVARRVARLQDKLGFALFEAVDGVRKPTPQCRELVAATVMMADQAERIAKIGAIDIGLAGRRRVAVTESIAAEVLAPHAPRFLKDHPEIALDFRISTSNVNFARWEADLAVRLQKPEKGDFIISKLADLELCLVEPRGVVRDGGDVVCAFPEDLEGTPESDYLARVGLYGRARCMTKNVLVARRMVKAGDCTAILPRYMCAEFMRDDRLAVTELPDAREVWLLVQPHLKDDGATRSVIDWIRRCFASLEGPAEPPAPC